jgi:hypothetical protein
MFARIFLYSSQRPTYAEQLHRVRHLDDNLPEFSEFIVGATGDPTRKKANLVEVVP